MQQILDNAVTEYSINGQISWHTTENLREFVMANGLDFFEASDYLDAEYGIAI